MSGSGSPKRKDTTPDQRAQAASDRRTGVDRRRRNVPVALERRAAAPEGERRKVERRINEYVLDADVLEFINAVNEFKSVHQKPFPTWSDIFEIFRSLGYRR